MVRTEKKIRTVKKVMKALHFTYLGRTPLPNRSSSKFEGGDVPNVIKCAKRQNEIFVGCDSTGGQNCSFPIDF